MMIVSEEAVRQLLDLDRLCDALTGALIGISNEEVSVPPRIAAESEAGILAAMPGYARGLGLAAKLVAFYPKNPELGLPAHQAVIVAFDEVSGAPLAMLDGTYITGIRTGMTAAPGGPAQ